MSDHNMPAIHYTLQLSHAVNLPGAVKDVKIEFVRLGIFTSDVCSDMPNDAFSHVNLRCGTLPRGY